jgi:hypothetical protein
MDWINFDTEKPPENEIVWTKTVKDGKETSPEHMIYKKDKWYFSDMSMFVYYKITHWKKIDQKEKWRV